MLRKFFWVPAHLERYRGVQENARDAGSSLVGRRTCCGLCCPRRLSGYKRVPGSSMRSFGAGGIGWKLVPGLGTHAVGGSSCVCRQDAAGCGTWQTFCSILGPQLHRPICGRSRCWLPESPKSETRLSRQRARRRSPRMSSRPHRRGGRSSQRSQKILLLRRSSKPHEKKFWGRGSSPLYSRSIFISTSAWYYGFAWYGGCSDFKRLKLMEETAIFWIQKARSWWCHIRSGVLYWWQMFWRAVPLFRLFYRRPFFCPDVAVLRRHRPSSRSLCPMVMFLIGCLQECLQHRGGFVIWGGLCTQFVWHWTIGTPAFNLVT